LDEVLVPGEVVELAGAAAGAEDVESVFAAAEESDFDDSDFEVSDLEDSDFDPRLSFL
jgi:hypothetical protein